MFLISCLLICYLIRIARLYYRSYWSVQRLSAIPQPPIDGYMTGHGKTLNKWKKENKMLELWINWHNTYGDTFVFYISTRPIMWTADPAILKEITTDLRHYRKFDGLPNRSLYGQRLVGTESILSGNGLSWALKRKVMSQFFAKVNMEELFYKCKPHMEETELSRWKKVIGSGKKIELHDQLAITFTSYLMVMGFHNFMGSEKIAKNVYQILEALPKQLNSWLSFLCSEAKDETVKMIHEMRTEAKRAVMASNKKKNVLKRRGEKPSTTNMLGFLIDANNQTVSGQKRSLDDTTIFTIDDIMTVCLVMDNMVKQISSLFMLLNDEPECQRKMFQELRETPIDTFEGLNSLKYTEQCILECLRLRPVLTRGTRTYNFKKEEECKFGGYIVNERSVRVVFSEYVLHHSPKYWEDPEKFNPERWYPGFVPEPFSYMPFFVGSRGCIGKHMAMMLMKLTLSVLARNFDMEQDFDPDNMPDFTQEFAVMRLKNNVDVWVQPHQPTEGC